MSLLRSVLVPVTLAIALAFPIVMPLRADADFADSPTDGKVVWMFTGAKSVTDSVSTSVQCSSFDRVTSANLSIEFYSEAGTLVDSLETVLVPGGQDTYSSQATFYGENLMFSPDFEGSARVVADGTEKIICSAAVLSTASPPTFAVALPAFGKGGKP